MPRRHPRPVPTIWLMTDPRMGDGLWRALDRLPRGAGVVFRHHGVPQRERLALLDRVVAVARRRRLVLVIAGDTGGRRAAGRHGRRAAVDDALTTWPVHDRAEAVAAKRAGADLLFVSPVFATRSHPGARALGPLRAAAIARRLDIPAIALGGMTPMRMRRLRGLGFAGWAAIDAWTDPAFAPDRRNRRTAR